MIPKLDKKELRKKIISLYKRYLSGEDIISEAQSYFMDYSGAEIFLDETLNNAIGYLENIGWNLKPQKEKVKYFVENLQKE
ncbi:MAG: hypothetical protein KJ949_00725 [Nanoarchaeota archaeon]|nr:hypothetical protein [Nanoarchaeota archaeon]